MTPTQIETTDALAAQRMEQDLQARGASYRTQIVTTKRDGLRYVITIYSEAGSAAR